MKTVPLTCTKCSNPFTHERRDSQRGSNPRYCPECRTTYHIPPLKAGASWTPTLPPLENRGW